MRAFLQIILATSVLIVASGPAWGLTEEDREALHRMSEAAQFGIFLGTGLLDADLTSTEADRNRWYRASFNGSNSYPGTAEALEGTLVRFRDAETRQVIDSPLENFDLSSGPPFIFDHIEDMELVGFKHILTQNRFERRLNWIFPDAGFEKHCEVRGDLRVHAPHSDIRLDNLVVTADFVNRAGRPFVSQGSFSFDMRYQNRRHIYSADVDLGVPRIVGPGATVDTFFTTVSRDGRVVGSILLELNTLRAWAFSSDGEMIVRLPGAPLGSATFDAGNEGSNEAPPGGSGNSFSEISGLAPDFTYPDSQGNLVSLSDPQFEGKIMLVNFCAAWCGPCRREFPEFRRLQAAYEAQGFQILTVGVFEEPENSYPLERKFGFNFPLIAGGFDDALIEAYGNINAIPTSYLLDRNHNVVRAFVGAGTKESFETSLLAMGLEFSDTPPPPFTDNDGDGWALEYGDCDDTDPSINPEADNDYAGILADGVDQDCNGVADDGLFTSDDDLDGWIAPLADCDDNDATINFDGTEVPGDAIDQDCDGFDAFATCALAGPEDGDKVVGQLVCPDGDYVWDVYIVDVAEGDCVDIVMDNDGLGADLLGFAVQVYPSPDAPLARSGLKPDYSELDDDWSCSFPVWSGFGCPARTLTASTAGSFYVGVAQWGGGGCTAGAGYSMRVSVNGTSVIPDLWVDDSLIEF